MILKAFRAADLSSSLLQRLGREFFWVGLGQGLSALGGIVGVRLLTQLLTPAAYGELALGMTVVMLMQLILSILSQAFLRFFAPAQEANQLSAYLKGVWVLLAQATAILLTVVGVLSVGLWAFNRSEWMGLMLAASTFALLSGYSFALDGIQNAARQRAVVALHQGLGQWLRFLAAVGLMATLGASSSIAMLGYVFASAVVLASQLVFFQRKILLPSTPRSAENDDVESWSRQMRSYAWPFATWGLFSWTQATSDRWALQAFGVTSDVGVYVAVYQLGYYPVALLSGLMVQLVSPVLFSRAGDGSDPARMDHTRRLNNQLVWGLVLLTVMGTALAFLLHSRIFSVLVAPGYRGVSSLLPWSVLSGGLFACGQVATLSLMSGMKTRSLIAPKIVTALLGVLLNVIGAYAFGLRGVVFASTGFSLLYFVWALYLARPPKALINLAR